MMIPMFAKRDGAGMHFEWQAVAVISAKKGRGFPDWQPGS